MHDFAETDTYPVGNDLAKYERVWSGDFSYAGMDAALFKKHYQVRAKAAAAIADELSAGKNPAFQMGTGGGKTIIAMLAQSLLDRRTLFLAPSKILVEQHRAFLLEEMGYRHKARVIHGETSTADRLWDEKEERYVFATPETVLSEQMRGKDPLSGFELVIFDEAHHARGAYAYGELANLCRERSIRYFGMSASLGSDVEDITTLVALMRFDGIYWYSVSLPPLYEEYVFVPLSEEQKRTEVHGFRPLERTLREWLTQCLTEIRIRLPTLDSEPLEARELDRITWEIEHAGEGESQRIALMSLAAYKKLLYAWRSFMADGYETFLAFVEKMIARVQTKERGWGSDKKLLDHPLFRRIVSTALHYRGKHPKEMQIVSVLAREARNGRRAIAFFSNKGAAAALTRVLCEQGVAAEFVFGSSSMRHDERSLVMDRFRQGKTLVLLATSVVEEGVSVPEVALVVDASTASEVKSRRQRDGRTARMNPGRALRILIEHPFDLRTFYAVHRKLKALEREESALASGERSLQVQYVLPFV